MIRRAWRVRLVLANLTNVPRQDEVRQDENVAGIAAAKPHWVGLTEAWHRSTRRAIRNGLPDTFRFNMPLGNSAVGGWDCRLWNAVKRTSFVLHGPYRFWDTRRAAATLLQQADGDRCVWFIVVHLAPPATKHDRQAQEAAQAAQQRALRRLTDFIRGTGFPVIIAGDWNRIGKFLGEEIYGREVTYSDPTVIDQYIAIDGKNVEAQAAKGLGFRMPHIDHRGGVAGYVTAWTR